MASVSLSHNSRLGPPQTGDPGVRPVKSNLLTRLVLFFGSLLHAVARLFGFQQPPRKRYFIIVVYFISLL